MSYCYVWYDSFICVTWLTRMCGMTRSYAWQDSFICATHSYPPDPINHVCSLAGKWICEKYFTYRSVQILKIMFPRFLFYRIWSSAQDHAVLVLLHNLVGFFISARPRWSGGNDLYHSCTTFEGAFRGGQPLNIFTWFIGAGGCANYLYVRLIHMCNSFI